MIYHGADVVLHLLLVGKVLHALHVVIMIVLEYFNSGKRRRRRGNGPFILKFPPISSLTSRIDLKFPRSTSSSRSVFLSFFLFPSSSLSKEFSLFDLFWRTGGHASKDVQRKQFLKHFEMNGSRLARMKVTEIRTLKVEP